MIDAYAAKSLKPGDVLRCYHLHVDTARDRTKHETEDETWVFKVDAKSRRMIVCTEKAWYERGRTWRLVWKVTTKADRASRSNSIPLESIGDILEPGTESFVELVPTQVPDNLMSQLASVQEIPKPLFDTLSKKAALIAQGRDHRRSS